MKYLHTRKYLKEGDVVVIECSHNCNVRLTTDNNFAQFKRGRDHCYCGGFYNTLPARIAAPHTDYWNIIIDLGGGSMSIRYSISIIRNSELRRTQLQH
ncbi:DUF1883 domain-containing protein [Pseudomonas asplenii]|uniref:DUF1883 domain-containing protein n=1 Tax=Pseudomonas asplenii TaxID=53407 RepID=UPI00236295C7|nr:DUF1883 domain-containing protein [Pseudomonas asplenii]